jgi:hypothetical protein
VGGVCMCLAGEEGAPTRPRSAGQRRVAALMTHSSPSIPATPSLTPLSSLTPPHSGDRRDSVFIGSHDADVSFCPGTRTHFQLIARQVWVCWLVKTNCVCACLCVRVRACVSVMGGVRGVQCLASSSVTQRASVTFQLPSSERASAHPHRLILGCMSPPPPSPPPPPPPPTPPPPPHQGIPDHVVYHPGAYGLPGLEVEPRFFAQVGAGRLALPKK